MAAQPATVADACSYAWTQLLAAEHVDLTLRWGPLAWLTTTAVREVWRLNELEWRATPLSHDDLDAIANADSTRPSTHQLASLHDRLTLIDELPERPRRFGLVVATDPKRTMRPACPVFTDSDGSPGAVRGCSGHGGPP